MNNNKTGIIWGLSIVVVILLIVCILFATNVISLNNKKEVKKEIKTNTTKKEYVLSKDDALAVVKNKFDYTEKFLTKFQAPCGESEIDTSIQQKDGMPYYRSNQYHSYNELNNDLLKYMSQEVISEKIKNKDDIYLEKDNNLYCWLLGGGDSAIYNPDKTEYDITKITNNTIEVKVTSYMDSVDNSMKEYNTTRIDNIKLVKKDNNWIISKHQLIN